MSSAYSIGLSAIRANQRALDIVGQNIANANNPAFHRQVVRFAATPPQQLGRFEFGTGVEINHIQRIESSLLETLRNRQSYELADTTTQVDTLRQIEVLLGAGEGSLHERLEGLFNSLEELSTRPNDISQRRILLGAASALTTQFNSLAAQLDKMRERLGAGVESVVAQINEGAVQIANLNSSIQRAEVLKIEANDQKDLRDQGIFELTEFVGLRVVEQDFGQSAVFVSGAPVVLADQALELQVGSDAAGNVIVTAKGSTTPLDISGGQLGGQLALRNEVLTDLRTRLDALASELARRFDALQATGIGLQGTHQFLTGTRAASDITVPLAQAETAFPISAGSLFITITNLTSGQQTLNEIAINPAAQSLQDVAAAITAVGNVQAIADAQTGTLRVVAQNGFAFDFAGRLDPSPDLSGLTGSAVATVGGSYTGPDNDQFNFRFVGSGTVGVTSGLKLEVRDSAASLLATLDVGLGYEPGTSLTVADGVTVQLSAGTVVDAETFSSDVVADSDTAGVLPALGLETFFTGHDAATIRVNEALLAQPERIAAARSTQPGDSRNLLRWAALRDQPVLGTETFGGSYRSIVGDVATGVQQLTQLQEHQQLVAERLDAERQSLSGVDPNEELVRLLQYQRSFQIAAQYIGTVNDTYDSLFNIL